MSADFSSDGRRVVTGSWDRTARVWDAESRKTIAILAGHTDRVNSAAFSPNALRVVTASSDKTARIWRLFPTTQSLVEDGKRAIPRCLTREQRERFFLASDPPSWCIEMGKWPYHTSDWKDWLAAKRAGLNPPFPDAPEWQSWRAAPEVSKTQ